MLLFNDLTVPSSMIDKAVCEAAVHECNAEDEEDRLEAQQF